VSSALLDGVQAALANRYRPKRQLASGAMAMVYLAEDLKHRRLVVIKVLRKELEPNAQQERFRREIAIAARLNHPHIVPLFDSGEAAGFLYFVMPYVEGRSLRHRLEREERLPVRDALRIAQEVADALHYAHSNDIVHRDIKPENILLAGRHAMVADFGIARAITPAGDDGVTRTGTVVGTISYMSPEQASGEREIDGRSDVYSLGCTLFEMLAGRAPFTGPSAASILAQHLTAQPPRITSERPDVSEVVTRTIDRALAKLPSDRFATASEFAEALERHPGPRRFVRARRPMVVAAGLLALAGTAWMIDRARSGASKAADDVPRIAVIAFENLGDPQDNYFAEGISDEIMTRLGSLQQIAVLAPQSTMRLRSATEATPSLFRKLDVDYLLRGRVRWHRRPDGSSHVRVTPRLVRLTDDRQIWAEDFDHELANVFEVQSQIATKVATALGVSLLTQEIAAVARQPITNLAALEHYMRGSKQLLVSWPVGPGLHDATKELEKALSIDPTSAAVHAKLSMALGGIRWGGLDPEHKQDLLARQLYHAERALALDQRLPDAHLAMGLTHYWGSFDYKNALREITEALRREPNNSFYLGVEGAIYKRMGQFDQAADRFSRASNLDPLTSSPAVEATMAYAIMRRYDKAKRFAERAWANSGTPVMRLWIEILEHGNGRDLRRWIDSAGAAHQQPLLIARAAQGGTIPLQFASVVRLLCGSCDSSIALIPNRFGGDPVRHEGVALLHEVAGRLGAAAAHRDSALKLRSAVMDRTPRTLVRLGRNEALRIANAAIALDRERQDRHAEAVEVQLLAETHLELGDHDEAIDHLKWLLSNPSYISVSLLRADPLWRPLHGNPRFRELIERHDRP
jgi:serine/threonine-protein kinase